jgi:hypothetical protein
MEVWATSARALSNLVPMQLPGYSGLSFAPKGCSSRPTPANVHILNGQPFSNMRSRSRSSHGTLRLFRGSDCFAGARDGNEWLAHDENRVKAQHAIAHACELDVTAGVRCAARAMAIAVNFHDEPRTRRQEVHDIVANRNLPSQPHPELTSVDMRPKKLFAFGERRAMLLRAQGDDG